MVVVQVAGDQTPRCLAHRLFRNGGPVEQAAAAWSIAGLCLHPATDCDVAWELPLPAAVGVSTDEYYRNPDSIVAAAVDGD